MVSGERKSCGTIAYVSLKTLTLIALIAMRQKKVLSGTVAQTLEFSLMTYLLCLRLILFLMSYILYTFIH